MRIIIPHTSTDFKKNEIKSLATICSRALFDSNFPELATAISTTYDRYRGETWKRKNDFEFAADFEVEIENKNHRVVLHGIVKGDYENTTYSIGICSLEKPSELIRRFHFDYDHDNERLKQKAPVSHFQYGGKSGNGFNGKEFHTNLIEDGLSVPRFNFPPINLTLLLDIVFCEFRNELTAKVVEDPNWRSLVKNNEDFLWKHYYQVLASHLQSTRHKKENLLRDICYGI
ncbi:MAG: hypothetical protein K9H64_08380 [Bacteroidales bacterium]|nr:hypothetical protein [Bacteroidales bacterium]MCF8455848.1 hypothetical protein [Bacteroidales bacterium]